MLLVQDLCKDFTLVSHESNIVFQCLLLDFGTLDFKPLNWDNVLGLSLLRLKFVEMVYELVQ